MACPVASESRCLYLLTAGERVMWLTGRGRLFPVQAYEYQLQIIKWPHKGGARDGARLGSMGIIHHARLINMIIIIIRRKRIRALT